VSLKLSDIADNGTLLQPIIPLLRTSISASWYNVISHFTSVSSTEWSWDKLPSSFVSGQDSMMWHIVWTYPVSSGTHNGLEPSGTNLLWTIISEGGRHPEDR